MCLDGVLDRISYDMLEGEMEIYRNKEKERERERERESETDRQTDR